MISVNLVLNLRNPFANTSAYQKYYHLWVWPYALITTCIMLANEEIGPSGIFPPKIFPPKD